MSDALPLPPRPNLEQYKKLARDLQDACKSSDPAAIREWASRWKQPEKIERRWNQLKQTNGNVARCTLAGAQWFVAREHGFTNWPKFSRHVQELARAQSMVSAFEAAADAIVTGDIGTLRTLLADHPGLTRERSTREHRSTLLHYVSANGVEDYRQKTPKNIVEIANLLLDAGADVNAESDAYGGRCTALGLVATSVHPERAGVQLALLDTMLARGAKMAEPSGGGNQHSLLYACFANGQPKAAEFLAQRGAPVELDAAGSMGRLDVVKSYFDQDGALLPTATRRQVENSYYGACYDGHADVVAFLLDHGIDSAMTNDGGETGLHCAATGAHLAVMQLLIERCCPAAAKDKHYQGTALDFALWAWQNSSHSEVRERCYKAVALLARAGAVFDPQQWSDPAGSESGMLTKINSDPRMQAALRGMDT
jgi:ankyrin repeat protein